MDLSDKQWALINSLLPQKQEKTAENKWPCIRLKKGIFTNQL